MCYLKRALGGGEKDKGPNATCGGVVCLYILRYIYTGFKPTNTNCSFWFVSVFFVLLPVSFPRGSSARGRFEHLSE